MSAPADPIDALYAQAARAMDGMTLEEVEEIHRALEEAAAQIEAHIEASQQELAKRAITDPEADKAKQAALARQDELIAVREAVKERFRALQPGPKQ